MTQRSSDREAIEAEIDRIRSLGLDGLRALWRTTFRSPPPKGFTKDLVARFICWHIQEQAFGGLDPQTAKVLDGFARNGKPPDRPSRPAPCWCANIRASAIPSLSCRAATSGARFADAANFRHLRHCDRRDKLHGAISRISFQGRSLPPAAAWSGYGCKPAARLTRSACLLMTPS